MAAHNGDLEHLEQLVADEPGLIGCHCGYRTPLHFAVRENHVNVAKWLVEHGADATFVTRQHWHDSPLQMARERGYLAMHAFLKAHLQQTFGICEEGTSIAAAIRHRDRPLVKELLAKSGPHIADPRGNRPLHWAVMTRQRSLIEELLQMGADVNAMRPDGARPLDLTNGDYWYRGWRDVHQDAPREHWHLTGFLIAKGATYDITTACRLGDLERVQELLAAEPSLAEADVPYSTWYSGFPLRSAAKAGHIRIVRLLLEHGADPNQSEYGLAPFGGALFDAVQNGNKQIVRVLLDHGANPNQEIESSGNVHSIAIHEGRDEEMLRLLESAGAKPFDPNAHDDQIYLQALNRDVNATDWHGIHKLHHCDAAQAAKLVSDGVEINLVDCEHQSTPLGWAARRGDAELTRSLLSLGADPSAAGADWATPVAWARRRGHAEVVKILESA
ncbi:MAG: ankyrin repeat domain-containing protein [Planctomycetota bacterium]